MLTLEIRTVLIGRLIGSARSSNGAQMLVTSRIKERGLIASPMMKWSMKNAKRMKKISTRHELGLEQKSKDLTIKMRMIPKLLTIATIAGTTVTSTKEYLPMTSRESTRVKNLRTQF